MQQRWRAGPVVALAMAGPPAARALPIAIASSARSVAVEATASSALGSDAPADGDAGPAIGPALLDRSVHAAVAGDATTPIGVSRATQTSALSADALSGTGTAAASASASRADDFAQGAAESLYRVDFTAAVDAALRLSGSVAASASGAADAFTFVELASLDSTLDPLRLHFEAASGASVPLDVVAALHGGLAYRLTALVRLDTDALGDESSAACGDWTFALAAVRSRALSSWS